MGMISERSGNCAREMPSAASVPRHVAISVDAAPMPMLCQERPLPVRARQRPLVPAQRKALQR